MEFLVMAELCDGKNLEASVICDSVQKAIDGVRG